MATKKAAFKIPAIDAAAIRTKLKLNQSEFWARVHCTQSAGSRYEGGRTIPKPVVVLLHLAYSPNSVAEKVLESLRPPVSAK